MSWEVDNETEVYSASVDTVLIILPDCFQIYSAVNNLSVLPQTLKHRKQNDNTT